MDLAETQRLLIANGYDLGKGGPSGKGDDGVYGANTERAILAFQKANKIQGDIGSKTFVALQTAAAARQAVKDIAPAATRLIPADWMPAAQMKRTILHWSAGGHKASEFDRGHYHILIEGDGKIVRGIPTIDKNDARGLKDGYAAHTLNLNSGSIGVAVCAMAGATEYPFNPGKAPMTEAQFQQLARVADELCARYGIDIAPQTVLSHAEVQGTLGIAQRGKIDIMWRPGMDRMGSAHTIGNELRALIASLP